MSSEMPDKGAVLTEHFKSLQGKLVNFPPNDLESIDRLTALLRGASSHEQPDSLRVMQDLRNWRSSVDPSKLEARIKSWADFQVLYQPNSVEQKRCENRLQSLQALKAAIDEFDKRFARNEEQSLRPAQELLDQQDRLQQEQKELEDKLTELDTLLQDTKDPEQIKIIQAEIDRIKQRIHKIRPLERHGLGGGTAMPEAPRQAGHQPTPNHSSANRGTLSPGGAQGSPSTQRLAQAQPSGEPPKLDEIEKELNKIEMELDADEKLLRRIESLLDPKNATNHQSAHSADDLNEFHKIADRNTKRIEALRKLGGARDHNKLLKSPSKETVRAKLIAPYLDRCQELSKKVKSIKLAQVRLLELRVNGGLHGPARAQSMRI
jgi:hypothetical protein